MSILFTYKFICNQHFEAVTQIKPLKFTPSRSRDLALQNIYW